MIRHVEERMGGSSLSTTIPFNILCIDISAIVNSANSFHPGLKCSVLHTDQLCKHKLYVCIYVQFMSYNES